MRTQTLLLVVTVSVLLIGACVQSFSIFDLGKAFSVETHSEHWSPRRCKCPEGYRCKQFPDGREHWPHECEKKTVKILLESSVEVNGTETIFEDSTLATKP